MYKLGDLQTLLKPNTKSWALIIPLVATIGPLLAVGRGQENALPALLVIPSLSYIGVFVYSMFIWLEAKNTKDRDRQQPDLAVLDFSSNDDR
jgi:amino acid permease